MQEVFNFLVIYWKPIFGVLCIIASIIIACIRKKPVNAVLSSILSYSLAAVVVAESSGLKGSDKLNCAVEYVNAALLHDYPALDIDTYKSIIVKAIETILSTPQKKKGE